MRTYLIDVYVSPDEFVPAACRKTTMIERKNGVKFGFLSVFFFLGTDHFGFSS